MAKSFSIDNPALHTRLKDVERDVMAMRGELYELRSELFNRATNGEKAPLVTTVADTATTVVMMPVADLDKLNREKAELEEEVARLFNVIANLRTGQDAARRNYDTMVNTVREERDMYKNKFESAVKELTAIRDAYQKDVTNINTALFCLQDKKKK